MRTNADCGVGGGFEVVVAQFNAKSLESVENRIGQLDALMAAKGVKVACFQEARTTGPRVRGGRPEYVAVAGGRSPTKGTATLGCEIWVNHTLPWAPTPQQPRVSPIH